jgi:hypothetical protein
MQLLQERPVAAVACSNTSSNVQVVFLCLLVVMSFYRVNTAAAKGHGMHAALVDVLSRPANTSPSLLQWAWLSTSLEAPYSSREATKL